uniref:NADH-ubiquinone oxidoreductase chain 4L n=1 Tax=Macrophiothrix sp. TaxID=3135532 RepID=A0AAU6PWU2_9ECHI
MVIFNLFIVVSILAAISIIYNSKFLLSVIISLEFVILNSIALIIYTGLLTNNPHYIQTSIFILALSAVEASIGVSLVALLSRNLSEVSLNNLNTLKT